MTAARGVWIEVGLWQIAAFAYLSPTRGTSGWWQLLSLWAVFFALSLLISRRPASYGLLLTAIIAGIGHLLIYRLDHSWALHHWQGWLWACAAFLLAYWIDWSKARFKYMFGTTALLLLLATTIWGVEIGGAKAWLDLGPLRFQPVELVRIFLVLFLAGFFFDNQALLSFNDGWPNIRYWGPLFLLMAGVFLFLAAQRDLGPALLFYLVYITLVILVATHKLSVISVYGGLTLIGALVAWASFPHFRNRMLVWLNPWNYPHGMGYQPIQGLYALEAGGFFGVGLGNGMADRIPEVHTDYIFALLGEELGFLGASIVIATYFLLLYWGILLANRTEGFQRMLCLTIVLLWGYQVFLVVGGILRVLPLTGMTLPFLSFGTTSLVANMVLLGIMMSLGGEHSG